MVSGVAVRGSARAATTPSRRVGIGRLPVSDVIVASPVYTPTRIATRRSNRKIGASTPADGVGCAVTPCEVTEIGARLSPLTSTSPTNTTTLPASTTLSSPTRVWYGRISTVLSVPRFSWTSPRGGTWTVAPDGTCIPTLSGYHVSCVPFRA